MIDGHIKEIIVVDSSAFLHRYYHGYSNLESIYNGKRINVGALNGYMSYIFKLKKEFPHDHLIHILDPEGGSAFRKELLPGYKSNRTDKEEAFTIQKNLLTQVLDGFQQPWIQADGIESDDIISTYCSIYGKDHFVLIAGQDKDLTQCIVDEHPEGEGLVMMASLVKDSRGFNIHERRNEQYVIDKFGVHPAQMADFLALTGDGSDNILGIPGVGDKKAAELLNKYFDIENIIMNANNIKGKLGENIRAGLDTLPLMKQLTRTLTDLELPRIEDISPVKDKELNLFVRELIHAENYWADDLTEYTQPVPSFNRRPNYDRFVK